MEDYREKVQASPLAWCPWTHRLVEVVSPDQIMRTVYHVTGQGVYPYVTKQWHESFRRASTKGLGDVLDGVAQETTQVSSPISPPTD